MIGTVNRFFTSATLRVVLCALLVSPCNAADFELRRAKSVDEEYLKKTNKKPSQSSVNPEKKPAKLKPIPKELNKAIKNIGTKKSGHASPALQNHMMMPSSTLNTATKRSHSVQQSRSFLVEFVEAFLDGTLAENESLLQTMSKKILMQEKQEENKGSAKVRYKNIVEYNGKKYFLKIATEAEEIANLKTLREAIGKGRLSKTALDAYTGGKTTMEICLPIKAETILAGKDKFHIVLQPLAQGESVAATLRKKLMDEPQNKVEIVRKIGHALGFALGNFHQMTLSTDSKNRKTALLHGDAHLNNFFILCKGKETTVSLIDLETMVKEGTLVRGKIQKDVEKMISFSFAHKMKSDTYHIHKLVGEDSDKKKLLTAEEWQTHGVKQILQGYISSFPSTERAAIRAQVLAGVKAISSELSNIAVNGTKVNRVVEKFEKDLSTD